MITTPRLEAAKIIMPLNATIESVVDYAEKVGDGLTPTEIELEYFDELEK